MAVSHSKAEARKKFEDVFPLIKHELLAYLASSTMPNDVMEAFSRVRVSLATTDLLYPMLDRIWTTMYRVES